MDSENESGMPSQAEARTVEANEAQQGGAPAEGHATAPSSRTQGKEEHFGEPPSNAQKATRSVRKVHLTHDHKASRRMWNDETPAKTVSTLGRGKGEYDESWHDTWAGILFVAQYLGMEVVAAFLGMKGIELSDIAEFQFSDLGVLLAPAPGSATVPSSEAMFGLRYEIRHWAPQLAAAALTGAVFSWLWLQLIKLAPRVMVQVSLWWGVVASLAVGVFLLCTSKLSGLLGFAFIGCAVMQTIFALLVQPRVPFAGAMLSKVVDVMRIFPGTIWAAYACVLVSLSWLSVWVVGAAGAMSQANSGALLFALLVSLYWTMEVVRNTVHVTVAGTVSTYYYQRLSMPPNPTGRSLWTALTKASGSICLGSFLVAILSCFHTLVSFRFNPSEPCNEVLSSCADCILSCLESIVRYFNKWAYVQVAVYGKSFISASRDTWDLFEDQGLKMFINDDLVSGILFMGCFTGGLLSGLVGGGWTYTMYKELTVAVAIVSFFMGYFITSVTLAVIDSGVTTYYVCYAEDPFTLRRDDPHFYDQLNERHNALLMF